MLTGLAIIASGLLLTWFVKPDNYAAWSLPYMVAAWLYLLGIAVSFVEALTGPIRRHPRSHAKR